MSVNPTLWAHLAELTAMCKASKCTIESHNAQKLDLKHWETLHFVGYQEYDDEFRLELRNCSCGSTLALKVKS